MNYINIKHGISYEMIQYDLIFEHHTRTKRGIPTKELWGGWFYDKLCTIKANVHRCVVFMRQYQDTNVFFKIICHLLRNNMGKTLFCTCEFILAIRDMYHICNQGLGHPVSSNLEIHYTPTPLPCPFCVLLKMVEHQTCTWQDTSYSLWSTRDYDLSKCDKTSCPKIIIHR